MLQEKLQEIRIKNKDRKPHDQSESTKDVETVDNTKEEEKPVSVEHEKRQCPYKKYTGWELNEKVEYAFLVLGFTWDEILTANQENGDWQTTTVSPKSIWHWCKRTQSYHGDYGWGFSSCYYPHVVNDERFHDWKWQLEEFRNHLRDGVTYYGWGKRWKSTHLFGWRDCQSNY